MRRIVLRMSAVCAVAAAMALFGGDAPSAQFSGPSTTQSAYVVPSLAVVSTESIVSVGDSINGYRMVGIPDGLGAFDNGDGTFTLLMNHELTSASGVSRAHGAKGALVSKWIIDKATLHVISASDLMQQVYLWDS